MSVCASINSQLKTLTRQHKPADQELTVDNEILARINFNLKLNNYTVLIAKEVVCYY